MHAPRCKSSATHSTDMSLHRFYLEDQELSAERGGVFPLRLSPADAKHARVLRLEPEEHIVVVDAAQDYFECEIVSFDDSQPLVRIARHAGSQEEPPFVILAQGLAKADKMETVIRHATELGVCGFIPLACERSIVRLDAKKASAKRDRWQAIAKSAAMQSGQPSIPEVGAPLDIKTAAESFKEAAAVLICWEEAPSTARLADALRRNRAVEESRPAQAPVVVVVGPEGGFSEHEVKTLLASNPHAELVSLGPSILRTETAGIVASALTLYELGGLGNAPFRSEADAHGHARPDLGEATP